MLTSETEDALLVHADDVDSGGVLDVLLKSSIRQKVLVSYVMRYEEGESEMSKGK